LPPCSGPAATSSPPLHDLRHTAVALWIAAGATPKEVTVRAGHTSVRFTLDRDGHQAIPSRSRRFGAIQ
jgi:integrase